MPHPAFVTDPQGRGSIETYTVLHGREGNPVRGIIVGRLEDGRRFLANTPDDAAVLDSLVTREGVGRTGRVAPHGDGTNRFDLD